MTGLKCSYKGVMREKINKKLVDFDFYFISRERTSSFSK